MKQQAMIALRLKRQHLVQKADEGAYTALYRDLQPGQNVYWNGFGQPPTLSFRADFDDLSFNRDRQLSRALLKGRFSGGNLGWIMKEDLELFACLYQKPLSNPTDIQMYLLGLIEREGPFNIAQIKEESGLLVKEITPALHRLQEAFLIYEDQYDGEWDRGWYRFAEMFPAVDLNRYTKVEALKIVLQRFAYRMVWFDLEMAKSFYKLPAKEIKTALQELIAEDILTEQDGGYLRCADADILITEEAEQASFVYAIHRNDVLYKAYEPRLKKLVAEWIGGAVLTYDHEPLQYLLIDGEFCGAVVGHFRNGPYDLNDVILADASFAARKDEILSAVQAVNFGKSPERFMGEVL